MLEQCYIYEGTETLEIVQKVMKEAKYIPSHNEMVSHSFSYGDRLVTTIVVELLLWRTSSTSSLTITMVSDKTHIDCYVVSSGAGTSLSNISWGSYKKILKEADKLLTGLGFNIIEKVARP